MFSWLTGGWYYVSIVVITTREPQTREPSKARGWYLSQLASENTTALRGVSNTTFSLLPEKNVNYLRKLNELHRREPSWTSTGGASTSVKRDNCSGFILKEPQQLCKEIKKSFSSASLPIHGKLLFTGH